jgi:hypothetical protein
MPGKNESKGNLEELTDAEIYAAIRYLEPDATSSSNRQDERANLLICISLFILLLGCVGFMWVYR